MENHLMTASLIFLLSAMLQGFTGFGFSLLAIPFLTLIYPPAVAVPLLVIYSLLINLVNFLSVAKHLDLGRIWILILGGFMGIPLGTYLLKHIESGTLTLIISAVVVLFCLILMSGYRKRISSRLALLPVGMASGVLCSSISLSGPPVIIFMASRGVSKNYFRANLAFYFLILNLLTVADYLRSRIITPVILEKTLTYLPALIAGIVLGNILALRLSEKLFRKIILVVLMITGLLTLLLNLR